MVALFVLVSPLRAMCRQCQFASVGRNCSASHKQVVAAQHTVLKMTPGKHCQQVANSQSRSPHLTSTGSCPDRPCQQLLDSASKMNRLDRAQLVVSFRSVASTEVSDDPDFVTKDPLYSPIGSLSLSPLTYEPLSVSLRI